MKRLALILAAAWLAAAPTSARAGELDVEYDTRAKQETSAPAPGKSSSELDAESPTQACFFGRWRRGFFGYGGFGYGGYGFGFGYGRGYYGYPGFGYFGGYGRGFGYGRGRW